MHNIGPISVHNHDWPTDFEHIVAPKIPTLKLPINQTMSNSLYFNIWCNGVQNEKKRKDLILNWWIVMSKFFFTDNQLLAEINSYEVI